MNDLTEHKSSFQRNWKWSIPLIVFLCFLFTVLFSSKLGENIVGIAKVYSESEMCDGALEIAITSEKKLSERASDVLILTAHNTYHTGQIITIRKHNGWRNRT